MLSILVWSLLSVILEFSGVCDKVDGHFLIPVENVGARTPSFGDLCQAPCVKQSEACVLKSVLLLFIDEM